MNSKYSFDSIVLILIFLLTLNSCKTTEANNFPAIPQERIGLNGVTYDQNGLAKRVEKALQEDPVLGAVKDKSKIYIGQNGNEIILRGTVSDEYIIHKILYVTKKVEGVTEVNIEEVKIR